MVDKKYMVLVVQYDAKKEEAVKKAVDDLRNEKAAINEVNCYYQGSDERIIKAVKSNLANAM